MASSIREKQIGKFTFLILITFSVTVCIFINFIFNTLKILYMLLKLSGHSNYQIGPNLTKSEIPSTKSGPYCKVPVKDLVKKVRFGPD